MYGLFINSSLLRLALTLVCLSWLILGCETNPYTERSQLLIFPESQEVQMGEQAYTQVLDDPKVQVSEDPQEVNPVRRVATRIIQAARQSRYAESARKFDWEITVIKDDKTKNAFALPGGKIAVYTGIFPEAKNEAGLAAIMGHEVVHALARHSGERMSQLQLGQLTLAAAAIGMEAGNVSNTTSRATMAALGVGLQFGVLLPYSRHHESEADYVGLLLAAQAGYDPREAPRIWQRMAQSSKGQPPEFLSTHPAHDTRIADLQKWMPEALQIYNQVPKAPVADLSPITPPQSQPHSTPLSNGQRIR